MSVKQAYEIAKEAYAKLGIDTDKVIKEVAEIPVSIHCWQGDDVRGFENPDGDLTGGIQTTGNYPGRARSIDELKADIEKIFTLIPGTKRLNLHAIYLDNLGGKVERNAIEPKHFETWIDFAKKNKIALDFNPTCFSHPNMKDGLTLSSPDDSVREYWVEHCIASRKIAEYFGKELGTMCYTNFWVPDGYKDIPVDRFAARARLKDSYDKIFVGEDTRYNLSGVESKVFGIGAESCTIGSHEFYMAYAMANNKMLTLDAGHYHPTEVISDKISSAMLYMNDVLLHVSRPVRWDSDHVVIFDDELKAIAQEIVRGGFEKRVHIGLDFFDASINRIAAWTIGTRNMQKALLFAKLEPTDMLRKAEWEGDFTTRLAMLEELKSYPFAAVWDYYCETQGVPVKEAWLAEVKNYEKTVLSAR
ncbi:MAG: L-rhamnose isomerase [Clostridia bacterium]|nr:L-rhamnose isomerase [Clostridia bacterium]